MDKYGLYNETKSQWEYVISDTEPTVLPDNPADSIKAGSIFIVKTDVETNSDGTATSVSLDNYKQLKYNAIDSKTGELIIDGGFTYNSKVFSLRETAQLNLLGVQIKRNDPILPLTFNTRDNSDTEILTTPTEVDNFFMAALGAKKAHLDSGTALKDSVRAAVDVAGVDAVVDNR